MSLLRSTLIVGLAAAASRILGFVRDVLIAAALGAGPVADAFLIAFRLPNLVRRVLGEGGLNASFVPLYATLRAERGAAAAARFAGEAFSGMALLLAALVALVEVAAGAVVLALAAGYADDPAVLPLATGLTRLAFPFVMGATLAALMAACLNAEHRFAAAALAPLAVNGVLVAAVLVLMTGPDLPPRRMAEWLAAAVAVSGLVQMLVVGAAIYRAPARFRPLRPRLSPEVKRLVAAGGPALAASGAAQLMILAATQVASFTPSAVSWLYYADRVFQLPLGFVGVAVGLVLLPEIAARQAARDRTGVVAAQNRALEAALLLALPAGVALFLLAGPIATVLFRHGAFGPEDVRGTAAALAGLAFGLPFAIVGKVLSQAFFARGRTGAVLLAGAFGIAVTVLGCLTLAGRHGVFGIGLGTSLGLSAHALMLAALGRREAQWRCDARLVERAARAALACGVMGAVLLGFGSAAESALGPSRSNGAEAIRLALSCGGGLLVYAVAARAFGAVTREDLRALLSARPGAAS